MTDLEKVIKGLRCIAGDVVWCAQCPYSDVNGSGRGDRCKRECAKDTLALLKAQEPVKPTEPDEDNTQYCVTCGSAVCYEVLEPSGIGYIKYNYCPDCGRPVKWDG